MQPSLHVSIPPSGQYARIVRAVAATAASPVLAIDGLEDLALAIDEACSQILQAEAIDHIEWTITAHEAYVDVVARAVDGRADAWPPADWPESLEAVVLHSIASDVEVAIIDEVPGVRFSISA